MLSDPSCRDDVWLKVTNIALERPPSALYDTGAMVNCCFCMVASAAARTCRTRWNRDMIMLDVNFKATNADLFVGESYPIMSK